MFSLQDHKTHRRFGSRNLSIAVLTWWGPSYGEAFFAVNVDRRIPMTNEGCFAVMTTTCEFQRLQSSHLFSHDKKSNSNDENENENDTISFPFLAVALPFVGVAALWPLLALLRDTNDPTSGFDIDMFMVIKGILDSGTNSEMQNDIIDLPPLSPAERLVDAIFGPP